MLRCKFYNRVSKEDGEVKCEAITNCGTRLRLCIVEEITGAVDIINYYHEITHVSISVNTADLACIESVLKDDIKFSTPVQAKAEGTFIRENNVSGSGWLRWENRRTNTLTKP